MLSHSLTLVSVL